MFSQIITSIMAVLALVTGGRCTSDDYPINAIDGYTTVDQVWEVPIPNHATLLVNGTVQQVLAHIQQTYPDYDPLVSSADNETSAIQLANLTSQTCGGFQVCPSGYINQGIDYLRTVKGKPHIGPGPNQCSRVSCSYDSAIYWCNDSDRELYLDNFGVIADAAKSIWTFSMC
ncbi:hypothetical protein QBC47DRAFT_408176 [Echria macrotheca]|uniref:Uncharacterized protein n=1 Tax=Echria macrotheca TaxID=438768 RepID=A0AAJ0BKP8_9PEZI|nr:hypothetical protein QBC47DRAFT_408176 [Echria macrotheca]